MASGNHYINNKELESLIIKYQGDSETYGNELFEMFELLINNIMDSFGFNVDRDDAKQECFVLLLKTVKNFDCDKGSAFNFFTTIIVNNLKLIYTKNKKYKEKMGEYINFHLKDYKPNSE